MQIIDISESKEILTVSRLNRDARLLLEQHFQIIWVEGEISNFSAPQSGHWYFCLKDSLAQIRCAMFKMQNRRLGFNLKDGMHVIVRGRISLYEGRGEFQLIADSIEEAGEGKLRQEFEALKKRLSEKGWFDNAHKKALPLYPQTIGIVTSPTGAAIKDILNVLARRFTCASIIIYPTLVQGASSAPHIVKAIQLANQRKECDVLILARGGGSLEDLWGFNEEQVAYAIYQSELPIISGVGHEIDFTIADFVADHRAPTPSAAAELVAPDIAELLDHLEKDKKYFIHVIKQKLFQFLQNLNWVKKHLQQLHPKHKLAEQAQGLDHAEVMLVRLITKKITACQALLNTFNAQLRGITPSNQINRLQQQLAHYYRHLKTCMNQSLQFHQQKLGNMAAKLDALSPLAVLSRGYSITMKGKHILHCMDEVQLGDKIKVQLTDGELGCTVHEKKLQD